MSNNLQQLYQPGIILNQRYRLKEILGQGGSSITYAAQELETTQQVAIKILSFRHLQDWKQLELFEREAKVLEKLNHPHIPRYLEYFTVADFFYIVQQLAQGKSLAQLVTEGKRFTEAEVKEIATQILETLIYLHSQKPPVIHRDIKPENIILDREGKVFLVDFGAVQNTYHSTLARGSTVVGTFGYMAPEQFIGQAVPASDLYGLGATLLFLLTHRSPADLPTQDLSIDVGACTQVSEHFTVWLEKMIEADVAARFTSAKQALSRLKNEKKLGFNSQIKWGSLIATGVGAIAASLVFVKLLSSVTTWLGLQPQGIYKAIDQGDAEKVERYLKAGVDPNLVHELTLLERVFCWDCDIGYQSSVLLHAAQKSEWEIVEILAEAGADVNFVGTFGGIALNQAIYEGEWEVVETLIDAGAYIDTVDEYEKTVFDTAIGADDQEMIPVLVELGADINMTNNNTNTPLHQAVAWGSPEMVETLIANGANIDAVNSIGNTPLQEAKRLGNKKMIKLLKSHGAKE